MVNNRGFGKGACPLPSVRKNLQGAGKDFPLR